MSQTLERDLPKLALPALAGVVFVLFLVRLAVAANTGLARDEGYYTLWSLHLSAGYLDHPPLVAYSIALGRALVGDNPLGVRLISALSLPLASIALFRAGTLLFDTRSAALAVLWYNLTLVAGLSIITTPDAPSALFWVLSLWALAEFTRSRNANWWLVVGVLAGLGVLGKYTNLFFGLGVGLYLLSDPERRRWLRAWQVWAGAGLALLVLAPNLAWNLFHEGGALWFQGRRTVGSATQGSFLANFAELVAGQALFVGPILVGLAIASVVWCWTRRKTPLGAALALPVLTSLPLLAYFIVHATHSRVEANWLVPVWPALTLAGAALVLHARPRSAAGRGLLGALRLGQPLLGGAMMALFLIQAQFSPFSHPRLDRTRELRGWDTLLVAVERLGSEVGATRVLTERDYGLTGQLAASALFAGSDFAVRPIGERLRYAFLAPLSADEMAGEALYMAAADPQNPPSGPIELFAHVRFLGFVPRLHRGEAMQHFAVFAVSAPTEDFFAQASASL